MSITNEAHTDMSTDTINWPAKYHPDNSAIHIVNTLQMDVPSQKVWDCLVNAIDWPTFYPNASSVRILNGPQHPLAMGTLFQWKTFGLTIKTKVTEFEPYQRLAWQAQSFGMSVCHAWLITPNANGCHVRTEETQNGFLPKIASFLQPGNIHKQHQIWLEGLHAQAATMEQT